MSDVTREHGTTTETDDRPQEACGVFGIYAPGEDAARITYFGLYALQHRGQESAGIAVSDGTEIHTTKAMGLIAQVFDENNLAPLQGDLAVGHTRYSTTGAAKVYNAQPFQKQSSIGPLALAHNGNLTNVVALRRIVEEYGGVLETASDSEVAATLLALDPAPTWEERLKNVLPRLEGSYCFTILTDHAVYGMRDPFGIRPLCIGRLGDGWVLASESCALSTVGATFERELEPGEVVRLDASGVTRIAHHPKTSAFCIFEYIYFARPDSTIGGELLHHVRQRLGEELAKEYPVEADLVIGVPDSATAAAVGYARAANIPFGEGLIKNRYIGRTFIQPDQKQRKTSVMLKFNPLPAVIEGKRLVVVDDSIVRGTTTRQIVDLLKSNGAREVHVRICCPPIMHPCFLGVDMATYEELIAANMPVDEVRDHIHADSLGFLSLDGLIRATKRPQNQFCVGCLTGTYPFQPRDQFGKFAWETRLTPTNKRRDEPVSTAERT